MGVTAFQFFRVVTALTLTQHFPSIALLLYRSVLLTVLKNNPAAQVFYAKHGYVADEGAGTASPSDVHEILAKCVNPTDTMKKQAEAAGLD